MAAFYQRYTDEHHGVIITNEHFTGHASDIYPTLIRSIAGIIREGSQTAFYYIGIASGPDYLSALKRRIDSKKLNYGVTRMYLLYASTSERYTRDLEDRLIERFADVDAEWRLWNSAPGGGGRPSGGPQYFLYLAVSNSADWARIGRRR